MWNARGAPGEENLSFVKDRDSEPHHFQNFREHIHISPSHNVGKSFWTLEQAIKREVRHGQESRTRGQVSTSILRHSGYVDTAE